MPFPTVAVIGLGLLGASVGLSLKRQSTAPRILACARRQESIDAALALGAIDAGSTDPALILPHADLTIICTPVATITALLRSHRDLWRAGAVVTDVGSVKGAIMRAAAVEFSGRDISFVGSHPMAGSDRSGLHYSKADLYDRATVFVTSDSEACPSAVAAVESFWQTCGARTLHIDCDEHDALVARTSHLPHILAAAAVEVGLSPRQAIRGTAGAFRDVTRIAGSSPEMWRQIFQLNRHDLLQALDEYLQQLHEVRSRLHDSDWEILEKYLAGAREKRRQWDIEWHKQRKDTE